MRIISPSLLSANFKHIAHSIAEVENVGAKRLHLDVMDGHFVSNLTFGPMIVKAIRDLTTCHIENLAYYVLVLIKTTHYLQKL